MGFLHSLDISASGLTAQRLRMDIISENLANISTTRTAAGGPYRRRYVTLAQGEGGTSSFASALQTAMNPGYKGAGVQVASIQEDPSEFKRVYDPTNPDAGADGYVLKPNVEVETELVDMIDASRAFDANITAMNSIKAMALKTLEIGK
jgi:flagellar basal-body rod protein FlgC